LVYFTIRYEGDIISPSRAFKFWIIWQIDLQNIDKI